MGKPEQNKDTITRQTPSEYLLYWAHELRKKGIKLTTINYQRDNQQTTYQINYQINTSKIYYSTNNLKQILNIKPQKLNNYRVESRGQYPNKNYEQHAIRHYHYLNNQELTEQQTETIEKIHDKVSAYTQKILDELYIIHRENNTNISITFNNGGSNGIN